MIGLMMQGLQRHMSGENNKPHCAKHFNGFEMGFPTYIERDKDGKLVNAICTNLPAEHCPICEAKKENNV